MVKLLNGVKSRVRERFYLGLLSLVILITLFLGKPLFTNQPLLAADLLFHLDPLWQPLAPPNFTAPANQVLSDQAFEFYPWQKFVRAEFVAGRLPLWNPYTYSGHPLLANAQAAPFDPFNVAARLWTLEQSFVVVAFLRLLCAGTFTLLLALALGLSRFAAYLAMVVFTFALPQVVWLLYPKASVLVWLPAMLFFSLRVMRFGKWRDAVALALVIAAQVVGGHPETALYNGMLWLVFCAYWLLGVGEAARSVSLSDAPRRDGTGAVPYEVGRAHDAGRAERRSIRQRTLWQLFAAALLGVGVSALQWLPIAESLLNSEILGVRSESSLSWQTVFLRWRDWLATLTMLMPDFFGNPRHQDYWFPYSNYAEQSLYVGVLPLTLAIVVLLQRGKGRQTLFFVVLALITLALALRLPGFALVAELPVLSVTNPARLRGIYTLAVALTAGYALDLLSKSITNDDSRIAKLLVRLLLLLGVLSTLIAAGAYWGVSIYREELIELARSQAVASQGNPFFFRPLEEYLSLAEGRVDQIIASFHPTNWRTYLPLIVASVMWGAWTGVCRLVREPFLRAQVLAGVIVALVVGELWLFGLGYNPTIAPEDVYPTPPLVEALLQESQDNEPFRVMGTGLALVPNTSMIFGLEDMRGYDPVAPRRYMALVSELSGATRVGHHLLFADASAPLLDFLNVRYAFADVALNGRWIPVQEEDGVTLYANPEAMPRAFIVYSSQLADSPAESLAMTLAPDFDFRTTVVLEGAGDPFRKGMPDRSPQVAVTHYVPGEMTVQVETATAGILVTSDPYVPGWGTRVDGQITELLIANHAFRAVAVPQGNHTVTFEYQPLSFRAGMWISGISLVVLLLILLWRLIWRKDSYG